MESTPERDIKLGEPRRGYPPAPLPVDSLEDRDWLPEDVPNGYSPD